MLRRVIPLTAVSAAAATQTRGIYSAWHTTVHEPQVTKGVSMLSRLTNLSAFRGFDFTHVPVVEAQDPKHGGEFVKKMNQSELYLYSSLVNDWKRLMSVDWSVDFDAFWNDRVSEHRSVYNALTGKSSSAIIGRGGNDPEVALALTRYMNMVEDALHWANETEKVSSTIIKTRFDMQRSVFDPLERERLLLSCVQLVEEFQKRVPSDFKRKALQEVEVQLSTMRHWVWDCPNAKQHSPRRLA